MLIVKNLTKTFNSHGNKVTAIGDISFTIDDGVFAAIVGKSGSGKTTLLSQLGALDSPTSGSIEVDGQDITNMSDRKLINYRLTRIGFVFQGYNLVPNLSALENVMLPMEFASMPKKLRHARAESLLEQVGITKDKYGRKPSRLSGGEQQRVAIARALGNKPKLILADEPTGNLDTATGKLIVDLLHHLARKEKTTIIAVTHDMEIARQTDLTLTISDGKLLTDERSVVADTAEAAAQTQSTRRPALRRPRQL
jgi:putative ABC transport system ATP-binding protein